MATGNDRMRVNCYFLADNATIEPFTERKSKESRTNVLFIVTPLSLIRVLSRYIDLVRSLGEALPMTNFKLTARFVNSPPGNPYLPATFKSKHSYVGLPMLKGYSNIFVDFRFKSLEPNGLLFYNGGKRGEFIAIELVNGHIHYVFDMGDGPITMRDRSRVHMNDNRWHSVTIRRPGPKTHTLIVDDAIEVVTATGNNMHLELEGILYVGGVFKVIIISQSLSCAPLLSAVR